MVASSLANSSQFLDSHYRDDDGNVYTNVTTYGDVDGLASNILYRGLMTRANMTSWEFNDWTSNLSQLVGHLSNLKVGFLML